tara:strand:- start:38 stop:508 length:471 start_codon:yes stop_codon:yes gene_type:complete
MQKRLRSIQNFFLIAGIPFIIFGLFMFFQVNQWGKEWEKRKEIADSGSISVTEIVVTKKWEHKSKSVTNNSIDVDYNISLTDNTKRMINRSLSKDLWKKIRIGYKFSAYLIEDEYYIPRLDTGGHNWGKWAFLGFGLSPLFIALISYLLRKLTTQA